MHKSYFNFNQAHQNLYDFIIIYNRLQLRYPIFSLTNLKFQINFLGSHSLVFQNFKLSGPHEIICDFIF